MLKLAEAEAVEGGPARARWTAIVMAGQRPGVDPLARAFGQTYKALVEVRGEPMLGRVLRNLLEAPSIGRIVVVAQEPAALLQGKLGWAAADGRITSAVSAGGIAQSIEHVIEWGDIAWPVFVTTADHPLLTPAMVEAFLSSAEEGDLSLGAVERSAMHARYAAPQRTWLKFADGAYSGANLFAFRTPRSIAALKLWASAEQDRKQAFRLFLHFGPLLAARAITRSIGFGDALAVAGRRLGLTARLVVMDDPDAAIDVDKPSDHALAEEILARRKTAAAKPEATAISVFDLDRTITRKPTYTAFLVYAALRLNPLRLLLAPAVIACMLIYLGGLISRRRVKELEHALLLGRGVSRNRIEALADGFARRVVRKGVYKAATERIAQERADGRRVIIASAANAFYLDAIARRLGLDEVIATASTWRGDRLLPRIEGENCYGAAKQAMLGAYLDAHGLLRGSAHIRFFSDHVSDLPTFEWADEPIAVNASPKLAEVAKSRGWLALDWR
jgi:HAD superfamily hydrolase (TIGR01490 family)